MQAKRKLTALLLSLCMLLGMLPMTAFAAGVPAAPTNLKLELTETGLKASWDKPETTGELDIFEYEVTLYGHFDGTAGGKTKVETKTVQRETTCTFTNTGNAEGVINPTYEVEVKAREGVSGTGDPDNLSGYYVTEWTGWSSSSSASYKTSDFSVKTSTNRYYTGVVDVGLPGSENKLYQEGITATGNPDVTQPDGTTSGNEKQAVTELLYQYFEENKETVPELADVTRDNLMVKTVLERIEVSRTVDPNSYQIVYEVIDKDYTLYLEFNPETEIVQPDTREIVNAVNLVNVSWNVGMGLTPAFTATVDEADQDKYEVYLEQWIGSDGKSITSEESFNSEISEDEKITTFEEGVTYYYSVWVKAKEGYAISEEASVYLDGRPADNGYTLANNDEPKRPDGSFLSGTFNSLFVMECVFDPLKVNGIEVTSANKDDILGDADGLGATVSYDPDTNTLTLNNATLTVSEDFAAIKEEIEGFIRYRSTQVSIGRMQGDKQFYNKVRRFLKECATAKSSLRDKAPETWVKQFRTWMFKEHIPLYYRSRGPTGKENISKAREIGYFERMLKFTAVDARREEEKDVWELDKLEIEHRENPIKRVRTLNFTRISQDGIRQELKKGIYLNLQGEAIACVQKELTAARRLSRYLADRYPQVQSCRDLNREIIEEYLTYLKTEATGTKHYHADLNRLRSLLESTGQMCDYPNLIGLFLTRDIPPTPKAAFKTYSDAELKRLNREIVKLDAQTARLMIIHQMLGTRISDTLTLTPDCLSERNGEIIIRIRQMKTKPYEKPISAELAALIKKAIAYTKEKYGDTTYIFVDEKNPSRPMPYTTVQFRITDMIYKKELRDDNGEIFGFGTHIYRHYYGMKLTEMHLDDWTIAKLLGHSSVRNVKYYRKMSNQLLADETRKARQRLSAVILDNLDGWEAEYEQIRQDDRLQ